MLLQAPAPDVIPRAGMTITQSVRMRPGEHRVSNATEDGTGGAITIRGKGITIDFAGATLRGTAPSADPDQRTGTAIYVEGEDITIRNANIHGYKHGIVARGVDGLRLENCDVSYNQKQRLKSTPDREDLSDWMSYHDNEEDQWLRFGAGIYLDDCDGAQIIRNRAHGGQNGLMMTETDFATIAGNDFSFLSSLGIGMYRSSYNRVMHNRVDWCVRGFSVGVYNRGQDSSGILIYEQSNRNVFAYNSVTHGGDGFFLWAGETTMDFGIGGCNDNLLFANDFSHAPTNGIEATFSRNAFVNNLLLECWHGIWGGYSWESLTLGNVIGYNAEGIAWEHGQNNLFAENRFLRNRQDVVLWQKESEDPNWGYPKWRDTRSIDNALTNNLFQGTNDVSLRLTNLQQVLARGNQFVDVAEVARIDEKSQEVYFRDNTLTGVAQGVPEIGVEKAGPGAGTLPATMDGAGRLLSQWEIKQEDYLDRFRVGWSVGSPSAWQEKIDSWNERTAGRFSRTPAIPRPLKGYEMPFLKDDVLRGRRYILVDEWGPYDFKRPILAPRYDLPDGRKAFEVLGPPGAWRVKNLRGGITVSEQTGTVPGELLAMLPREANDLAIELEYVGAEVVDVKGQAVEAGKPFEFSWSKFILPISWTITQWNYDKDSADPREDYDAWLAAKSVRSESSEATELNFAWPGAPQVGISPDYFGTIAEGVFTVPPGDYVLELTSDDGVRVYLDGELIHDDWTYHAPKTETLPMTVGAGKHTLRIEHFELNGYSALKALIKRAQ